MPLKNSNPTHTKSWQRLTQHYQQISDVHMRDLFERDADRFHRFSLRLGDLLVDFSKNRINDETLEALIALANEVDLRNGIEAMYTGDLINITERRAVLHTALRTASDDPIEVDGRDVIPGIRSVQALMKRFVNEVHSGKRMGYTGRRLRHIVNIGIGGSDLGPRMAVEALRPYHMDGITTDFVANVDGAEIADVLAGCDVEETLFIIASKSFSTQETMRNAQTAREWFLSHVGVSEEHIAQHFVAVSTNVEAVTAFGIDPSNMFEFWDWVGGRYSVASAIGLSVALTIGYHRFEEMLEGMSEMDEHFRSVDFSENIPFILALISIWYTNFFGAETEAILPYAQHLHRFAAYFQQANMESNGESYDRDGHQIDYATGPIVWGEPGTNGQHAFYQLIHQGTHMIPCDFIGVAQPHHGHREHHDMLLANFFAQTEALMKGRTPDELRAARVPEELVPFKRFDGNRPTNSILIKKLTPHALGQLIAMYEHKIFVQGYIWNIFTFDQWGVELGKILANNILPELRSDAVIGSHDASTNGLINTYKEMSQVDRPDLLKIKGVIKNYAWGGRRYIPELIGRSVTKDTVAEYWIGTHQSGTASVILDGSPLSDMSQLPYLLKVLDVAEMLSIQCHPNKAQAESGFARENAEGVLLTARQRIFKDDNHKPELMVALSDFWLLHGLRSLDDIRETIESTPELGSLLSLMEDGLESFFKKVLRMSQGEVTSTLVGLRTRLLSDETTDKNNPDYWAKLAFDKYGYDRGILCIYCMNIVHLTEGQAIYQEAGVPHAYLEGQNIEIMANSDNVFRLGLTPKHVDVEALIAHLDFDAVTPSIISASDISDHEVRYESPATEFELRRIRLARGESITITTHADECLFCLDGSTGIQSDQQKTSLSKGQSAWIADDTTVTLIASGESDIIRATVPR